MLRPASQDASRAKLLHVSPIRPIQQAELSAVRAVLRSVDLPAGDISDSAPMQFWVREEAGTIAGVVGLERTGKSVLLRSLAILPNHRDRKFGREFVAHAENEARRQGFRYLSLLTTSAEGFFRGLGYTVIDRAEVPADIQQTRQFTSLCPASAICMTKAL